MKLLDKRPSFTPKQRAETHDRQGGLCYLCQISLADGFHVDHRVSLALYGAHEPGNWEALCIQCHARKTKSEHKVWSKVRRILKWNEPKEPSRLKSPSLRKHPKLKRNFRGQVVPRSPNTNPST